MLLEHAEGEHKQAAECIDDAHPLCVRGEPQQYQDKARQEQELDQYKEQANQHWQ